MAAMARGREYILRRQDYIREISGTSLELTWISEEVPARGRAGGNIYTCTIQERSVANPTILTRRHHFYRDAGPGPWAVHIDCCSCVRRQSSGFQGAPTSVFILDILSNEGQML
jgi:hypothetical protein